MMQHQYWVTKKTVLNKLGTKEDECVVSSDAELDAKLELFRSISDSCLHLQRLLDHYQERLCILAQEENSLGKFLRDAGKGTEASGKHMITAGKAISYSGQQRLLVRGPLLRLYHEVETFRGRAVSDMRTTVSAMEKARTEYRAALSWMKSTSAQLDPDTGRGLDNFRKAQRQVRESKKLFDKLTLDVLQKIDLLAAARCNMFSHVLANYQSSFLKFSSKVAETLTVTASSMNIAPQYEFCILKDLSQNLGDTDVNKGDIVPQDKDQMLFFQDEFKDEESSNNEKNQSLTDTKPDKENILPANEISNELNSENLIDTNDLDTKVETTGINADLAGLKMDCTDMPPNIGSFLPSQLLQSLNTTNLLENPITPARNTENGTTLNQPTQQVASKPKVTPKKGDKAAWFKLFAELDPLENPDSMPGVSSTQSHAA